MVGLVFCIMVYFYQLHICSPERVSQWGELPKAAARSMLCKSARNHASDANPRRPKNSVILSVLSKMPLSMKKILLVLSCLIFPVRLDAWNPGTYSLSGSSENPAQ